MLTKCKQGLNLFSCWI